MNRKELSQKALEKGNGVFHLIPTWVPRSFCRPGKRIKLHPSDYYIYGLDRGAIDERWFSSTTHAENGPKTTEDEGLSYIIVDEKKDEKILLRDAIEILKEEAIGDVLYKKYGRWPIYSKFFDNLGPLPHHIHHNDKFAARVGQSGKPEMYFFPSQVNNHGGEFPFTFFGINPDNTKQQVKHALENFSKGDNNILSLSRSFKLELDTGWDVPPGVLHSPGSLCTYEPQFASDVFAMYQSVLYYEHCVSEELLWKDCPPEEKGNFDYLIEVIDWEINTDPDFHKNRFMQPKPVKPYAEMKEDGYIDEWICYKCNKVSAKRLTVLPGRTVTIKDNAAYGIICLQGNGVFGGHKLETPTLIRYGQLTNDEYFVTEKAAKKGIIIKNCSTVEDIVILKHFAENPDLIIQ
ncbi:hypothetical protein [Leadbettera azotonutricia]|uniref:Mannose-6-phosphate isomerase n=1 Tax=Leadbettera azotonutricia (strain ATCC BAA-888 / DSM 13862 / ZAS-9) TaxID=545695 RepID=F5Y897_LEAAZ|nr:hypothetical protein [Leadbettera azotonutricia]AEF81779.1 conserved hypothetical protein [Leadbettera azotonutricia ZAS-9]